MNKIDYFFSALLFGDEVQGDFQTRHIGCIDPQCHIISVVKDAYENARLLCDQYYLRSPELVIKEVNCKSGTYYTRSNFNWN